MRGSCRGGVCRRRRLPALTAATAAVAVATRRLLPVSAPLPVSGPRPAVVAPAVSGRPAAPAAVSLVVVPAPVAPPAATAAPTTPAVAVSTATSAAAAFPAPVTGWAIAAPHHSRQVLAESAALRRWGATPCVFHTVYRLSRPCNTLAAQTSGAPLILANAQS